MAEYSDINKRPSDVPASEPVPMVVFNQVSKQYGGREGLHVVDNVSFQASRGEFISILGPSGCGKSTMMMLASGLYPLTSGSINIDGQAVNGPYTNLGIVFQQDLLMEWRSVLQNILIQIEFRNGNTNNYKERAYHLLSLVGLNDFEHKFPYQLSGGMRQRLSICRALIHEPNLLLMDEPFGALDALTRDQLNLDIQRIWHENKKTVLFVTHSIAEAVFLADRVFVMSPRPTRILEEMPIELERPRDLGMRETPLFAKYVKHLRSLFYEMGALR